MSLAAPAPTEVLLHAERTPDPQVVRWIVRGHLPGPCVEPVRHLRGGSGLPPFVVRLLDAVAEVVAVTVRAEHRDDADVLRVDVGLADAGRWRAVAESVQAAVQAAAATRWWPDEAAAVAVGFGRVSEPSPSLPSGPCRSCPRSSSRTSSCGRPPGPPPASI